MLNNFIKETVKFFNKIIYKHKRKSTNAKYTLRTENINKLKYIQLSIKQIHQTSKSN